METAKKLQLQLSFETLSDIIENLSFKKLPIDLSLKRLECNDAKMNSY